MSAIHLLSFPLIFLFPSPRPDPQLPGLPPGLYNPPIICSGHGLARQFFLLVRLVPHFCDVILAFPQSVRSTMFSKILLLPVLSPPLIVLPAQVLYRRLFFLYAENKQAYLLVSSVFPRDDVLRNYLWFSRHHILYRSFQLLPYESLVQPSPSACLP